jgi:MerR family transcriptional regulator, light-induced transcriptional regulator
MSDDPVPPLPPLPPLPPVDLTSADVPAASLSPELLASLLTSGDDELAAWTLRHALREAPRAIVYDGLLREAMQLVGERWATGRWSVADEHLASRTLMRALEQVRPQLGPEARVGPVAVLAGVAGEQHMIGLICLEQTLQEQGWTTANLGADVPSEDLARYVADNDVALVALSASNAARLDALGAAIAAVRGADRGRGIRVLLGGRITVHGTPGLDPAPDWAGTSLVDAAAYASSIEVDRPVVTD